MNLKKWVSLLFKMMKNFIIFWLMMSKSNTKKFQLILINN